MKKMIVVFAAVMLLPKLSGSAEFSRTVSAENVIENRGGLTVSAKRSSLSRRIENFAVRNGLAVSEARVKAEILSYLDHPRALASMSLKEARFNENAVGALGEIGAFQQRPDLHGHPGRDFYSQAKSAERLLNDLVRESGGQLDTAVRRYNGAGPKAERYAKHVMLMARSI